MKWIMQAIYELLSDFFSDGFYDVFENTISFRIGEKHFKLKLEELD